MHSSRLSALCRNPSAKLILFASIAASTALAQVNTWTKPTSGYWEEPYWSLGHLPAYPEDVAFTNAGWKALAIGPATTVNFPDSLHISSLDIYAPTDSQNLLLLNYAGLSVPLHVDNALLISTNGSLLSYYSAVQATSLQVNGHATFAELSQAQFDSVTLGDATGTAELNLSNGWFSTTQMLIGHSNATFRSGGTFNLSGGTFACSTLDLLNAGVIQNGGTNQTATTRLIGTHYYIADYDLRDGRLESQIVHVGPDVQNGEGQFHQSGGVHSNSAGIFVYGGTYNDLHGSPAFHHSGICYFTGGLLFSPMIALAGGLLYNGGTNYVGQLWVTNAGFYDLNGGTLICDSTYIQTRNGYLDPQFYNQGEHHTALLHLDSGGVYDLGGILVADYIYLGASTQLRVSSNTGGGNVISNKIFELNGGTSSLMGTYDLGWLRFNGTSYLDCGVGGTILRFTKVGYPGGALNGVLYIKKWKGSPQSPGIDQIYITQPDQSTPSVVRSIFFIDPPDFPPGPYRARIKPTGEIVPIEPAHINFSRDQTGFTLTWPQGYRLYSSPNVDGTYQPVPNATSPYHVSFTDPRRFFLLRPDL